MFRYIDYNKCDVLELENKFKDGLKRLQNNLYWNTNSVCIYVNPPFQKWSLTSLALILLDCFYSDPCAYYLGLNKYGKNSCTIRTAEYDYIISVSKKPQEIVVWLDVEQLIPVYREMTEITIRRKRHYVVM